jgi:transposase InsO family protein
VRIDKYSGIIFATAQTGEKAPNDISHCLQLFVAWRMPRQIKTNNGPADASQRFYIFFINALGIKVIHGLPYNHQRQGIVERANATSKTHFKTKSGNRIAF